MRNEKRCETCTFWDNEFGEWGVCTLSDPDNQYADDPPSIRARTINGYESVAETRRDHGCVEHSEFVDTNR